MDKKTLKQYRALVKEQKLNEQAIERLYDRAEQIPSFGKSSGF